VENKEKYVIALEHIKSIQAQTHQHLTMVMDYVIDNGTLPPLTEAIEGSGVVKVTRLNLRTAPNIQADIIGHLQKDDTIQYLLRQKRGDEVWVYLEQGRWAAMEYQGQVLIEEVG
jgi:hypothetical protein